MRDNFERARKLHLHGVLEYEFFTAAGDYALLVLEGALRVRFLAFYSDGIPLVCGETEELLLRDVRSRTCSKHAVHGCAELMARPTGCR